MLPGCAIARWAYPSPEIGLPDARYLYRTYPSELGGDPGAPTGVEFERGGVRVAVGSPRRFVPPRDASAGVAAHPEPVCERERAAILIPPVPWIFTSDLAKGFEVEVAIEGADASFDASRVTLEPDATARAIPAVAAGKAAHAGDVWTLRFETPCDPGAGYTLRIGGLARNGIPIDVPPIRFVPARIWLLLGINGGAVLWPPGAGALW